MHQVRSRKHRSLRAGHVADGLLAVLLACSLALGAGCDEAEDASHASVDTGSHAGGGGSATQPAMDGSMHTSMDASFDAAPPQHEPTVEAGADATRDATVGSDAAPTLTGA